MTDTILGDEMYIQEYEEFIANYKVMEVGGEKVGELIARMAQYYARYNAAMIKAQRALSVVAMEMELKTDDNGKQISSAKAGVLTAATEEAYKAAMAKSHVQNIEQYINALKALMKGLINEYAYQQ